MIGSYTRLQETASLPRHTNKEPITRLLSSKEERTATMLLATGCERSDIAGPAPPQTGGLNPITKKENGNDDTLLGPCHRCPRCQH